MITSIILTKLKNAFTDLLPIILVIAFFQVVVLRPHAGNRPIDDRGERGFANPLPSLALLST